MENLNNVTIVGRIVNDLVESHEVQGEIFLSTFVAIVRTSGVIDKIPVLVSERLLTEPIVNNIVKITGQFRSHNKVTEEKSKLELFVFVKTIEVVIDNTDTDEIELNGYVCKPPIYRTTPLGREICNVLVAVNRAYNKSDYIPVICWGRTAKFAASLAVGTSVNIKGRIQSRIYNKILEDGTSVNKDAYEVSVSSISIITE